MTETTTAGAAYEAELLAGIRALSDLDEPETQADVRDTARRHYQNRETRTEDQG